MSDTALANDPAARSPTGEILDQANPPKPEGTTPPTPESTPKPEEKSEPKAEAKPKEGESLLNKDEKKPDAVSAPEKYEDFKLPEGFTIDDKTKTEANELFKGLNLSQEGGQRLMDYYTAKVREAADAPHKAYAEMRQKWQAEFKASELGPKETEVKATVSRALDAIGDPKLAASFRVAMDITGAGDHPAFIAVINKLASAFAEGKFVKGGGPSPEVQKAPGAAPASAAKALYPNLA